MDTVICGGARVPRTAVVEGIKDKPHRGLFACFVDALRESRIEQARRVIERHAHLLATETRSGQTADESATSGVASAPSCYNDSEPPLVCPITRYPCEGDRSHLCKDYGCARKGGLSPHSDENFE